MKPIFALLVLVFLAVSISSCGGGGGGAGDGGTGDDTPPDTSKEDAANNVAEGKAIVESAVSDYLANFGESNIPFADLADASNLFIEAAQLDPENPEAQLYGGVFRVVGFLDSDPTNEMLARMGWPELRGDGSLEELADGITDSWSDCELEDPMPEDCEVREGDLGIPYGPNASGLRIGDGETADLTVVDVFEFATGDFADALGEAVSWLERVPPDFQSSLNFTLPDEGGDEPIVDGGLHEVFTLELDYSDAKALQAALATIRAGLVLPTIWNYPGLDSFIEDHRNDEGAVEIVSEDFAGYFNNGNGSGIPFSANQTGKENLKSSLSSALLGLQDFLTGITAETDDQSDDLLKQSYLFDGMADKSDDPEADNSFDDKDDVIAYFLEPVQATMEDVRQSIVLNSATIHAYQAAAFIQNWDVCDPVADDGEEPDGSRHNDTSSISSPPTVTALTDVSALNSIGDINSTTSGRTYDLTTATAYSGDNYIYLVFTLDAPAHLSIYSEGGFDPTGALYYLDRSNPENPVLVPWDFDEDSGAYGNFGISVDASYFDGSVLPAAESFDDTLEFVIRVDDPGILDEGDVALVHVVSDRAGSWPSGEPIFLKGGGGRRFSARVYELGSVNASLGGVINVATTLWDKSHRDLVFVPDNLETPDDDESTQHLTYTKSVVRSEISKVFPSPPITDWGDLAGSGDMDLFSPSLNVELPSLSIEEDPALDVTGQFGGPLSFCAYPKHLGTSFNFAGGRSVLGDATFGLVTGLVMPTEN